MPKIDSTMKGSQRFNPLLLSKYPNSVLKPTHSIFHNILTRYLFDSYFERVITKVYKLSDGFVIPACTTTGVLTHNYAASKPWSL